MTKEEAIQKESERRYPLDSCTDLPHPFAYEKAEDILDKRVLFREGAKWAMEEYGEQRWVKLDKGDLLVGEWLVFWDSQDEEAVYDVVPYNREMPSRYTHWMRIEPPKD